MCKTVIALPEVESKVDKRSALRPGNQFIITLNFEHVPTQRDKLLFITNLDFNVKSVVS